MIFKPRSLPLLFLFAIFGAPAAWGQFVASPTPDPESILKRAVEAVGGDRYLAVKTQIGRGRFSTMRDGAVVSFQSFYDVIVFPGRERTEFKGGGERMVQANDGENAWFYDGAADMIRPQSETQIANFDRGIRGSLDTLLRGDWRGRAELSHIGRRQATVGKRNDVLKLTYKDGFAVEFEIADDGKPVKAIRRSVDDAGKESVEEDRYGQFVEFDGVRVPMIIDRFTNGVHMSRINYQQIEFNKPVSDSLFAKPASVKELKRSLEL